MTTTTEQYEQYLGASKALNAGDSASGSVPLAAPMPPVASLELFMGDLTLGMMEDLEVALGFPMSEAADRPGGSIRLARAMIYVRRKALDPSYTMEATHALPPSAMVQFAEALAQVDPGPPVMP